MSLSFVRMAPDDLDLVVMAEQVLNPSSWTLGNFRDALHAGYEAWLMLDGAAMPAASPADRPLRAYAVMEIGPDDAHLHILGVRREWQRQGYARSLLRYLQTLAATRGAERLLLEVRESNLSGRGLYASLGFTEIARRKNYYPAPLREDALVLARDLRSL